MTPLHLFDMSKGVSMSQCRMPLPAPEAEWPVLQNNNVHAVKP